MRAWVLTILSIHMNKKRQIIVTNALPYANSALHLGHILEYTQTDIWVRFQRMKKNDPKIEVANQWQASLQNRSISLPNHHPNHNQSDHGIQRGFPPLFQYMVV